MLLPISVIIPTYQRANLLGETIESVLAQSHPAAEVIVVIDGSTDDTEQTCAHFAGKIKCKRIEKSGVQTARNTGVALSASPWLAFCDDDDLMQPDHLESVAKLVTACPQINCVFSNFRFFGDHVEEPWQTRSMFEMAPDGFWEIDKKPTGDDAWFLSDPIAPKILRTHNYLPFWVGASSISRQLYDRIGGFNSILYRIPGEDFEFTFRCIREGQIGVTTRPTVCVRNHSSNQRGTSARGRLRQRVGDIVVLGYVIQHHNLPSSLRDAALAKVDSLSEEAITQAFSSGQLEYVRALSPTLWKCPHRRCWKLMIKAATALLPAKLGATLNRILVRGDLIQSRPIDPYLKSRFDETVSALFG
jgi:glycosyltransferase involved in cell wall biosynthesis